MTRSSRIAETIVLLPVIFLTACLVVACVTLAPHPVGAQLAVADALGTPTAKRVGPADVPPVVINGVRIEAIQWGRSRGLDQNGGYIAAIDVVTGKEVWILKIYTVVIDPKLEEDVQEIFIQSLSRCGDMVKIVDEKGRVYCLDPVKKSVIGCNEPEIN